MIAEEKMGFYGPRVLDNEDLFRVLFGIDIGKRLAKRYKRLRDLRHITPQEILDLGISGVGPTRARQICAAVELGRRISRESAEEYRNPSFVKTPQLAANYVRVHARDNQESFWAIGLSARQEVIFFREVSG